MTGRIGRFLLLLIVLCLGFSVFLYFGTAKKVTETRTLEARYAQLQQENSTKEQEAEELQQQLDALREENADVVGEYQLWEHEIEKIAPYLD